MNVSSSNVMKIVPVGIDIGSLNARIAISQGSSSTADNKTTDTNNATSQKGGGNESKNPNNNSSFDEEDIHSFAYSATECSSQACTILPNEAGDRFTLALSTVEPDTEADPLNDQYWDDPNKKKKQQKGQEEEKKKKVHIFGEAARRSLQRQKQRLEPHYVQSLLQPIEPFDDETPEEREERETQTENNLNAADDFFSYLITQTTNATHTHPDSLRVVLSVPYNNDNNDNDDTAIEGAMVDMAQRSLLQSISTTGWSTAPSLLNAEQSLPNGKRLNKKEKKEQIKKLGDIPRIMSVLADPMAICLAHDLFQFNEYGSSWNNTTKINDNGESSSSSSAAAPPKNWKNVIVVDWGASSLKLTHLQRLGNTQTLTPNNNNNNSFQDTSLSGTELINLLIKHVSELFERSHRGAIPPGEVLLNKKARAKLHMACEGALRTLSAGFSHKVQITVDGLFEGMDCNVEVMKARFDMLCGTFLRKAESKIKSVVTRIMEEQEEEKNTNEGEESGEECYHHVALMSGNVMRMPAVKALMDKLFPSTTYWRGKGFGDVPPEEAVALGCAAYASMLSSPFCKEGLLLLSDDVDNNNNEDDGVTDVNKQQKMNAQEKNVPLCPIGIGLSMDEEDSASVILIESGSPLPAAVIKTVDVTGCSSGSLGIVQIANSTEEKVVGKIEGIENDNKEVEIGVHLSVSGQLSFSVNRGPTIVL